MNDRTALEVAVASLLVLVALVLVAGMSWTIPVLFVGLVAVVWLARAVRDVWDDRRR